MTDRPTSSRPAPAIDSRSQPGSSVHSAAAERVHGFGESIFAEMTALAQRHGAVNLGQGFPDFPPPDFVLEAAREAIDRSSHQYARMAGDPQLTEMIARDASRALGRTIDPLSEVTVTVGATEALFATTLALIEPGDEAILLEPFYDSYPANMRVAGGVSRGVPLRPDGEGRWTLDLDELRRAVTSRSKVLFLNSPQNPTGKVFRREELEAIAALCCERDLVAIADEVYERIVFDDNEHLSLASLPGMWERTVTISSAGKSFSVTGWKIGWTVAPAPLSEAIRRIHQWIPFCVSSPLQTAVARVLGVAPERGYYEWLREMYQAKRDRLVGLLRTSGLRPLVPEGTYFVMADITTAGFDDDVAFCRHLTREIGVAAIPPSAFYSVEHQELGRRHARFCFCKAEETIDAAESRLRRLPAVR